MRICWAVSGSGMAARAVVEAHSKGLLASTVDLVVLDRQDSATTSMQQFCKQTAIETRLFDLPALESGLLDIQRLNRFDCMALTFNRLLPQSVIDAFHGKLINLHMSLLPAFPGFGATRKALASGASQTGVTVHFIDAGMDTGPVIAQSAVDIVPGDTVATLGFRQFQAAVPLILQTVRQLERQQDGLVRQIDEDLAAFGADYCRSLADSRR